MKETYRRTYKEEELPSLAKTLLERYGAYKIWAFDAVMGAGKTTLIKALCEELGVRETTASPTFAIINEYQGSEGPVYHFDCYRFETLADAYSIGTEEYLDSDEYCFVEWPEVIEPLLPTDRTIRVGIGVVDDSTRTLTIQEP